MPKYRVTFTVQSVAIIEATNEQAAIDIAAACALGDIVGGDATEFADWDSDFEFIAEVHHGS